MERVISSSPYAFIYMCRLGPALTTHMGQSQGCDKVNDGTKSTSNLTLPSNNNFITIKKQDLSLLELKIPQSEHRMEESLKSAPLHSKMMQND